MKTNDLGTKGLEHEMMLLECSQAVSDAIRHCSRDATQTCHLQKTQ